MDLLHDLEGEHTAQPHGHAPSAKRTAWLALGALGVVFGDIGTSPLYALHETFNGHHVMAVEPGRVMGVLSIIFWTMVLVVTVKYVAIMMRADNRGEGGSLSLLALISRHSGRGKRWTAGLTVLGVLATALFFGDAMITPAVSVLSAVEGLEVLNAGFAEFVIPVALAILIGLFMIQKRGTETIGAIFGPVMLVYFVVLGILGVSSVFATPEVLWSLSPVWGARFIAAQPGLAFFALGSIVLAVTGAETLYADMSHFGRRPIRIAWLGVAFPMLMVNYLGQGALLLRSPAAADSPFYLLASEAWRLPLVILATVATVIASQAVITGAYSVVRQAVQLGLFPRLKVLHTSARAEGQIYVPLVNWSLLVAIVLLVLGFKTSSNLASAYGIAVTGTMLITTIMLAVVLRRLWHWPLPLAAFTVLVFGIIDGTYFVSNLTKFTDGGWFPLLVAACAFTGLTTWARGRALVRERMAEGAMPVPVFVESVGREVHRVRGTAIYLTASSEGVPPSMLHNLKHNQVLHEQVLLLKVSVLNVPTVAPEDRVKIEPLGHGMKRVTLRYGFTEDPDVPAALAGAQDQVGKLPPMTTSYFISRQTVIATKRAGMALWREHLFAWMVRNSATAMEFFKLPPNRVVELGSQIEI